MLRAVSAPLVLPVASVDRAPLWAGGFSERVAVFLEPFIVPLAVSEAQPITVASVHCALAVIGPSRDFD